MLVENKVVLVTGSSQGIGREVAQQLSRMKAKVVFASRSIDKLQSEANIAGNDAIAVEMDITNEQSISTAIKKYIRILEELIY